MSRLLSIFKYDIPLVAFSNERTVALPKTAVPIAAGNQREKLVVWVQGDFNDHDPDLWIDRTFIFIGTGHAEIDPRWAYIDTVMFTDGALVLHVFEKLPS